MKNPVLAISPIEAIFRKKHTKTSAGCIANFDQEMQDQAFFWPQQPQKKKKTSAKL